MRGIGDGKMVGKRRARWFWIALGLGAWVWTWTCAAIVPAFAQGADRPAAAAGDDDASDDGGPARTNAGPSHRGESFLSWMARASGPIGLLIAIMSLYLVALITWMALNYRTVLAMPPQLLAEIDALLDKSRYHEAYQRLEEDPSFLANVLAAGVRKLPLGLPPAQRAMELANEDATMRMEHRTTYLATMGTLGPMIGLVGTVYGMILAFRVIAQEGSAPQASELAAGISTALFATLEGIALSIPAIYFYAFFRNRIARLSLEVGLAAEPLLERFAPGVRPAPEAAPGPNSNPSSTSRAAPAPATGAARTHPFAVSATRAAGASGPAGTPPPALPPTEPPPSPSPSPIQE